MARIVTTERVRFEQTFREWQRASNPGASIHGSPTMQGPDVDGSLRYEFHGADDTLRQFLQAHPEWVDSVK